MIKASPSIWIILFAFLSFLTPQDILAQHKVYVGIKAGGNFSKTTRNEYSFVNPGLKTVNTAHFGLNPNPELGLIANISLSERFSFQPEILLVKKGYKAFGIYNDENGQTIKKSYEQWDNSYLELPLLAKLAVGDEKIQFFFAAGPTFSYWYNSYYNRDRTGENVERQKFKVEHKFRRTVPKVIDTVFVNGKEQLVKATYDSITVKALPEIGAAFATGFHYKLKKSMFIFDIRYYYGLTERFKYLADTQTLTFEEGSTPPEQPARHKEFNRRFSFSISYLFSFKS